MTYRDFANKSLEYQVSLRDRDVELKGLKTYIRRPLKENVLDFYGDLLSQYSETEEIYISPLYKPYYQIIDLLGQEVELNLALQAVVKVRDYIPNDSLIHLMVRNNQGSLEMRWWRVLSTQVKHLDHHYSRIAFLVPIREPIFESIEKAVPISSDSGVESDAA